MCGGVRGERDLRGVKGVRGVSGVRAPPPCTILKLGHTQPSGGNAGMLCHEPGTGWPQLAFHPGGTD